MLIDPRQVEKAEQRAAGVDLRGLVEETRGKTPAELAPPEEQARRRQFLVDSLGNAAMAQTFFERIINGNELQDVNYLARGARAARAVARVCIRQPSGRQVGYGTGFLIAPGVLITNHHVLPDISFGARSSAEFEYEYDLDGNQLGPVSFDLLPGQLFHSNAALDYTVVAVAARPENGAQDLAAYGFLPLVAATGKVNEGEWLTVIQHPDGHRKQVCVRENRFIKRTGDVLWYSTDTLPGSSGSPVFSNDWYVVALHHSGVPQRDSTGAIQTIDGAPYDQARDGEERVKWIANEGIRVSRIVETLQLALPAHPLLQAVYAATPANARLGTDSDPRGGTVLARGGRVPARDAPVADTSPPPAPRSIDAAPVLAVPAGAPAGMLPSHPSSPVHNAPEKRMEMPRNLTVALTFAADGSISASRVGAGGNESLAMFERTASAQPDPPDVPFDPDYSTRPGYDPKFLGGGFEVPLPKLLPLVKDHAVPVDGNDPELKYFNYSVVMHKERRFAIYSAANLSYDQRYEMRRPPDVWRYDTRIDRKYQVGESYYKSNKFDRGHLTRREDLEYGRTRRIAVASAADTCHFTNCTPQHSKFNQGKSLWQGIEMHILENAVENDAFNAQLFTGPVFDEGDPEYRDIQYPLRYWKVVVAVNSAKKLFATAYILDQSEVIAQYGIEAVGEVPFAPYGTYQVKVQEVEALTGLKFTGGGKSLSDFDPLEKAGAPRPRRRRSGFNESTASAPPAPPGYYPLDSLESIHLG
jgi:endonuclease G